MLLQGSSGSGQTDAIRDFATSCTEQDPEILRVAAFLEMPHAFTQFILLSYCANLEHNAVQDDDR